MKTKLAIMAGLVLALSPVSMLMASEMQDVAQLQERWAEVNYQIEGKSQLTAFEQLIEQADAMTAGNPGSAALWTWSGIIKSTYAGAKGGLGALGMAKAAKADLEKAMKINAETLDGSAVTSLGILYHSVPGWPVGFGDEEKAEELLARGVALNPQGIDTNYFYATYLLDRKRYQEAQDYLQRAQQAAPRPHREVADVGRQKEITEAMAVVARKL
jgi:tetratricopeptide (TPR) repeat protein